MPARVEGPSKISASMRCVDQAGESVFCSVVFQPTTVVTDHGCGKGFMPNDQRECL